MIWTYAVPGPCFEAVQCEWPTSPCSLGKEILDFTDEAAIFEGNRIPLRIFNKIMEMPTRLHCYELAKIYI